MKILHVINDLNIGGAQKLVHDLALLQNGDPDLNVSCFTFQKTGSRLEHELISQGIEIIFAESSPYSPSALKKLNSSMKRAELVHAHLFPSGYITSILKRTTGARLVFTEHSTHNRRRDHKFLRPIERNIYSRFDSVACISEATAANLAVWLGAEVSKQKLVVIENGINRQNFLNSPAKASEEIFGRAGKPLLMISRFTPSKDHLTVVRALSHIEDKDVFVAFAGDGETRKEVEIFAEENGLAQQVVFLGTRTNTPELIKSAEIGIQSSNWEGFGLTAIEMMAGGKPVIASEVIGLREVVGDAGLLFPNGDDNALARCIEALLGNEELYRDLQHKGLERSKDFSIESSARKYKKLYNDLTGKPSYLPL